MSKDHQSKIPLEYSERLLAAFQVKESPQKLVLQILEFHRQQYPFEENETQIAVSKVEKQKNKDRYYQLSGFLNDFLEKK